MRRNSKLRLLKKTASLLLAGILLAGSLAGCGTTADKSENKTVRKALN